MLKWLSMFFVLLILQESTIMVSCLEVATRMESESCCPEEHEKDSEDDNTDCTSGCNPFQNCGCCKGSSIMDNHHYGVELTFSQQAALRPIQYHEFLPDGVHYCPEQPPKC